MGASDPSTESIRPSQEPIDAGAEALNVGPHIPIGCKPDWTMLKKSEAVLVAAGVGELQAALRWALTTISDSVVGHWDDDMSAEFEKAQQTLGAS